MTGIYLDHFKEAHRAQIDPALTELLARRKKNIGSGLYSPLQ